MVSWSILYLRQQIIPLVKENTMVTLYAQLNEEERNQIYEFLHEEPFTSGFGGFRSVASPADFFLLFLFFPLSRILSPRGRHCGVNSVSGYSRGFNFQVQHRRIRLIRFLQYIYGAV